jgi:hypothetical protein
MTPFPEFKPRRIKAVCSGENRSRTLQRPYAAFMIWRNLWQPRFDREQTKAAEAVAARID